VGDPRQVSLVIPPLRSSLEPTKEILTDMDQGVEPLGLSLLAAVLRQEGFRVDVRHAKVERIAVGALAAQLVASEPDLIGVALSFATADLEGGLALIEELRRLGYAGHITGGGHTATHFAEDILDQAPGLDSLCIGEAEQTLLGLAKAVTAGQDWHGLAGLAARNADGKPVVNPRRELADLDALPFPSRDFLQKTFDSFDRPLPFKDLNLVYFERPIAQIESSRGCWGRCEFCAVPSFFGKGTKTWRGRSAPRIVDELEAIKNVHGVDYFDFIDDNFIGPGGKGRERMYAFVEEMRRRRLDVRFAISCRVDSVDEALFRELKSVGLSFVGLGVESGSQTVLDRFAKGIQLTRTREALAVLQRLDIRFNANFIMFDPDLTMSEMAENIAFLDDTDLLSGSMRPLNLLNRLVMYPGTASRRRYVGDAPREGAEGALVHRYYELVPFTSPAVGWVYDEFARYGSAMIRSVNMGTQHLSNPLRRMRWILGREKVAADVAGRVLERIDRLADRYTRWYRGLGAQNLEVLKLIIAQVADERLPDEEVQRALRDRIGEIRKAYDMSHLGMPFTEYLTAFGAQSNSVPIIPLADRDVVFDLEAGRLHMFGGNPAECVAAA